MRSLGKRLVQSAHEALDVARGEASDSQHRLLIPNELDIKGVRHRLGMTQVEFSQTFGFPLATLRDWEQRRSTPDSAARSYLTVIDREPAAVERALSIK